MNFEQISRSLNCFLSMESRVTGTKLSAPLDHNSDRKPLNRKPNVAQQIRNVPLEALLIEEHQLCERHRLISLG
jgi:hypothetical protein